MLFVTMKIKRKIAIPTTDKQKQFCFLSLNRNSLLSTTLNIYYTMIIIFIIVILMKFEILKCYLNPKLNYVYYMLRFYRIL